MKRLVRCKLCGYVMTEDALQDVCPACGVARRLFEPYEDPVEPARRKFLALDIHPVVVHAPQALTFLMLLLLAARPFLPAAWLDHVVKTITVMALLLPPTAAGAFFTGLLDGSVRFGKLKTPLLRQKIVLGAAFFALTLGMLALVLAPGFPGGDLAHPRILLLLNVLAFVCCSWLGVLGVKLLSAIFAKRAAPCRPQTGSAAAVPAQPS
jgi:hypothetical protein